MSSPGRVLTERMGVARARIADAFDGRDGEGRLIQGRDALNLAGLGLTVEELEERFVAEERGLGEIGFEDLLHLRYLDLTGNQLERLPRGVARFEQLRWLGLNFNRIESLSRGAGNWPELRCLYLRGNRLRTLPEKSLGWGKLMELDLFGNPPLASLPPGLALHFLEMASGKESGHVVLGNTALWKRMRKAGLTGGAETSITREMLEWIFDQKHQPEPVEEELPTGEHNGRAWLRERIPVPGALQIARALAGLGQEDRTWLPLLEDPEVWVRRPWSYEELHLLGAAVESAAEEGASRESGLWEAWYAAGLEQAAEAGRDRAPEPAAGGEAARGLSGASARGGAVRGKGGR